MASSQLASQSLASFCKSAPFKGRKKILVVGGDCPAKVLKSLFFLDKRLWLKRGWCHRPADPWKDATYPTFLDGTRNALLRLRGAIRPLCGSARKPVRISTRATA